MVARVFLVVARWLLGFFGCFLVATTMFWVVSTVGGCYGVLDCCQVVVKTFWVVVTVGGC